MSQTAEALALAATLCRRFEGFRAAPYLCPANVWTIGFGSTRDAAGRPVTPDHPPITQDDAEWLMREDLARFMVAVLAASPSLAAAPAGALAGALAAMTDFAYNLGAARYRASTLRRRVDVQDWAGAREELAKWTRGGGKVLPGLVKRREAEAALLA